MRENSMIYWGSAFGFLSVLIGALGAHSLKLYLNNQQLISFETGVKYHMYHSIALLICGILSKQYQLKGVKLSSILFILGIVCFSFSIYILSTKNVWGAPQILLNILGPITPLGGLLLAAGWFNLFVIFLKSNHSNS